MKRVVSQKSTSAITISQILAISGYKVLIIDLDPQNEHHQNVRQRYYQFRCKL